MAVDAFLRDPRAPRVAVVLDALRGELAFALYERSDAAPRELVAPRLTTPAELLASTDVDVVLASPQRARVLELLGAARSVMAVEPSALPLLALHRAGFARLPRAVPLYLRASAAEEKARAKSQGNP
jgi:tRNA A37 threonylcarbamoyladenosine modification protein TsaB